MNWLPWLLVIALAAYCVITQMLKDSSKKDNPEKEAGNYTNSYQAKYLLTRNEWYEYKKLKKLAAEHDLQVCPKVRLLDIIEPRKGDNYRSLMVKIQSKHVDFVICDQDLHIKGILELDDNSHNQTERQQRDLFVDGILTSVGYKVIRTRSITDNTLDPIVDINTNNQENPC